MSDFVANIVMCPVCKARPANPVYAGKCAECYVDSKPREYGKGKPEKPTR